MDGIDMQLKALWDAGKTSSEISEALGITRSAVMGRVFRLRSKGVFFAARPAIRGPSKKSQDGDRPTSQKVDAMPFVMPKYVAKKQEKVEEAKPDPVPPPAPDPAPEKAKPVTLLELESHHCRFIVKTHAKRGALYCGEPKKVRSYCAEHAKLCYNPVPKKSERPKQPLIDKFFRLDPFNVSRL